MKVKFFVLLVAMVLLAALPLSAQTNPTGIISGKVVDPDGLAVPGATVTLESPALQGTRTAQTSTNGDYIIPFLPAGEYTVTFTLPGFRTVKQTTRVSPSETITINPTLAVSTVSETVTVVGQTSAEFNQTAEVQTNFKQDLIDKLPTSRRFLDAAQLAPGVQNTGPNGGLSINGAMSFESLYVVNGVVVNENIRGQPNVLFIEDALQETTITTAAVSAEFGRFQGGVVQAITKSGGNEFSGSYRMTFDNNDWVALTPFPNDSRMDKCSHQEATLGGPIVKDKLWFFGAARLTGDRVTNGTTFATNLNFDDIRNQKRFEGKLTFSPTTKHTFKGAYTKIKDTEDGNFFGNIMDFDSLVNGRATPQHLISANYTGIVSPKFFVEGQYSRRNFTFRNSGSLFTDLIKGTLLIDQSRNNARYNSPTFCGVCDQEKRDNQNVTAKATYFAVHGQPGRAQRGRRLRPLRRQALRQQPPVRERTTASWPRPRSSRARRCSRCSTTGRSSAGRRSSWARRATASAPTPGSSTTPGACNRHLTFNLGVRWDKNSGVDSQGRAVVKDSAISPRFSATFDPKGDGAWTVNAAYAQYVAAIANSIGDAGSAGGQPATIDFTYLGPPVNIGNPANPVSTDAALNTLFGWFNANGGTNRTTRGAPSIPGPEHAHRRRP